MIDKKASSIVPTARFEASQPSFLKVESSSSLSTLDLLNEESIPVKLPWGAWGPQFDDTVDDDASTSTTFSKQTLETSMNLLQDVARPRRPLALATINFDSSVENTASAQKTRLAPFVFPVLHQPSIQNVESTLRFKYRKFDFNPGEKTNQFDRPSSSTNLHGSNYIVKPVRGAMFMKSNSMPDLKDNYPYYTSAPLPTITDSSSVSGYESSAVLQKGAALEELEPEEPLQTQTYTRTTTSIHSSITEINFSDGRNGQKSNSIESQEAEDPPQSVPAAPFQINNRMLGWKLTDARRRRDLIKMLDMINEVDEEAYAKAQAASLVTNPNPGSVLRNSILGQPPTVSVAEVRSRVSAAKKLTQRQLNSWESTISRQIKARTNTIASKEQLAMVFKLRDEARGDSFVDRFNKSSSLVKGGEDTASKGKRGYTFDHFPWEAFLRRYDPKPDNDDDCEDVLNDVGDDAPDDGQGSDLLTSAASASEDSYELMQPPESVVRIRENVQYLGLSDDDSVGSHGAQDFNDINDDTSRLGQEDDDQSNSEDKANGDIGGSEGLGTDGPLSGALNVAGEDHSSVAVFSISAAPQPPCLDPRIPQNAPAITHEAVKKLAISSPVNAAGSGPKITPLESGSKAHHLGTDQRSTTRLLFPNDRLDILNTAKSLDKTMQPLIFDHIRRKLKTPPPPVDDSKWINPTAEPPDDKEEDGQADHRGFPTKAGSPSKRYAVSHLGALAQSPIALTAQAVSLEEGSISTSLMKFKMEKIKHMEMEQRIQENTNRHFTVSVTVKSRSSSPDAKQAANGGGKCAPATSRMGRLGQTRMDSKGLGTQRQSSLNLGEGLSRSTIEAFSLGSPSPAKRHAASSRGQPSITRSGGMNVMSRGSRESTETSASGIEGERETFSVHMRSVPTKDGVGDPTQAEPFLSKVRSSAQSRPDIGELPLMERFGVPSVGGLRPYSRSVSSASRLDSRSVFSDSIGSLKSSSASRL